jgi:hypothetical protein
MARIQNVNLRNLRAENAALCRAANYAGPNWI